MAMTRAAAPLAALLALAACGRPYDDFTRRYYVEIYAPFFAPARDADGREVYRAQRPGAFPGEFSAVKEPGVKRVFVVGGSVAQQLGTTDDFLKDLRRTVPGGRVELLNCGMAGYDSYRDKLVALEILRYRPDLVVLLTGNNEFYRPVKINPWLYGLQMRLKQFPPLRTLRDALHAAQALPPPTAEERLAQLAANLRDIGAAAKKRGVPVVFCALPADPRMPPHATDVWQDPAFVSGWLALDRGRARAAESLLGAFAAAHPQDANAAYFLARAEEAAGDKQRAAADFAKSLNLQDYRCGPAKNEVIRAAAERDGILADLDGAFAATGGDALIDGTHWFTELNGFVSAVVLEAVRRSDFLGAAPPFLTKADWNQVPLRPAEDAYRAARPGEKAEREVWYAVKMMVLLPENRKEEEAVAALETAFRQDPAATSALLLSEKTLEAGRAGVSTPLESPDRVRQARPRLLAHAGEALRRLGRPRPALTYFDEALRLDPDLPWALLGRAMTRQALGRSGAARADAAAALRTAGSSREIAVLADLLAQSPKAAESSAASGARP